MRDLKIYQNQQYNVITIDNLAIHYCLFCSFRILKPALELLFAESKFKAAPSFQFTKLQALPCGCPTMPFKESDKFLSMISYLFAFSD